MTFDSWWRAFGLAQAERVVRLVGPQAPAERKTEAIGRQRTLAAEAWEAAGGVMPGGPPAAGDNSFGD